MRTPPKKVSEQVSAEIVQNGDGFEVRPPEWAAGGSRVSVDWTLPLPRSGK